MAVPQALLVLALLASVWLAGCSAPRSWVDEAEQAPAQWRAGAEAFQSRDASVVVVSLWTADPAAGEAENVPLVGIELEAMRVLDGGADRNGSAVREVRPWTIQIHPESSHLELHVNASGYDEVAIDAVLLLEHGGRMRVPPDQWLTFVSPPWHADSALSCADGTLELSLRLYERRAGEAGTSYSSGGGGTLEPLVPSIADVEAWEMRATGPEGTRTTVTEVRIQPETNELRTGTNLSAIDDLEYAFRIRLDDGLVLTQDDFGRRAEERMAWDARC